MKSITVEEGSSSSILYVQDTLNPEEARKLANRLMETASYLEKMHGEDKFARAVEELQYEIQCCLDRYG